MNKILGLLLTSTLLLAACGNDDKKKESKTEAKKETVNENKPQFKDNVAVIDDAVLTIKDVFLLDDAQSEENLLGIKYEVKNKTDKEITSMLAWIAIMKAYQDGENTINELHTGIVPHSGQFKEWTEHENDTIKKGKTAKGFTTVVLQNDNDVVLKATKGDDGIDLGEQTIKLNELKTIEHDDIAEAIKENN